LVALREKSSHAAFKLWIIDRFAKEPLRCPLIVEA